MKNGMICFCLAALFAAACNKQEMAAPSYGTAYPETSAVNESNEVKLSPRRPPKHMRISKPGSINPEYPVDGNAGVPQRIWGDTITKRAPWNKDPVKRPVKGPSA